MKLRTPALALGTVSAAVASAASASSTTSTSTGVAQNGSENEVASEPSTLAAEG